MARITPSRTRTADIVRITRYGEDHVGVEMANGKLYEVSIDELIQDWLFLHKKVQQVKGWAKKQVDSGEVTNGE